MFFIKPWYNTVRQFVTILPCGFRKNKTKEAGVVCSAVSLATPFFVMERYSIIKDKQPREIVLLRGAGCVYKRCTFCDYHTDCDQDTAANFRLNQAVLDRVTGLFGEGACDPP